MKERPCTWLKKLHKTPSITKESTKNFLKIRDDLKRFFACHERVKVKVKVKVKVLKVIFASLHLKSNCLMGGK